MIPYGTVNAIHIDIWQINSNTIVQKHNEDSLYKISYENGEITWKIIRMVSCCIANMTDGTFANEKMK